MKVGHGSLFLFLITNGLLSSANLMLKGEVGEIVDKLKDMLKTSKEEGEEDDKLYKKFKAYCEKNTEEKTKSVQDLTGRIEMLKGKIAELLASNGELSIQCSKLRTSIHSLKDGIASAKELREKQHDDFLDVEKDNEKAMKQCKEAIKTLAEIGADQTQGSSAEHEQFMAGFKGDFAQIKETLHKALVSASSFLTKKQTHVVESFIQAPFTGTYSAQSGEVVGILKNMLDTFKTNLLIARGSEDKSVGAFEGLLKLKESSLKVLEDTFEDKQKEMASNDEELALKKDQLAEAEKSLEDDQEFLAKLIPMCKEKAHQYVSRKTMRKAEQEAIEQAIKILTSDSADEALAPRKKSKFLQRRVTPALLQMRRSAAVTIPVQQRGPIIELLRKAGDGRGSIRLAQVAMALESGNPFNVILDKIDNIIKAIAKEGKADEKELEFCKSERKEKKDDLKKYEKSLRQTKEDIKDIGISIDDEKTGLISQIHEAEEKTHEIHENMEEETKERAAKNKNYQAEIKHTQAAQHVIKNAIKILKLHYEKEAEKKAESAEDSEDDPALLQKKKEDPPKTWDSGEAGDQSEAGNKVIGMLEKVLQDMVDTENKDHGDEQEDQETYEDSMKELAEKEKKTEETIAELKLDLADAEKDLVEKKQEKEATEDSKDGVESYLKDIKPSCDFIDKNFEKRVKSREDETKALKKAIKLLKSSPGYTMAKTKAEEESWGKCKSTCKSEGKDHAKCQACLGGISVPGYCAGHASAPGC